jgi:glutamate-1-semialdehyde 2,1-aminomutase
MAAGIATLKAIQSPDVWDTLLTSTQKLSEGISTAAKKSGIPITQNRVGTMFATFFTQTPVVDWSTAATSNTESFAKFFHGMLERGIYLAPSQFETGFLSTAHSDAEIEVTITAAAETFQGW